MGVFTNKNYYMTNITFGNNVLAQNNSMANAFRNCYRFNSPITILNQVTNISNAFFNCYNLRGAAVVSDSVIDMSGSYRNCYNLTTAACGNNVINMSNAYANCRNLTTAVCGNNVVNMSYAYEWCNKLITPVCGPNVINMRGAYEACFTNYQISYPRAVCGPNVEDMSSAYSGCYYMNGPFTIGPKVKNCAEAYSGMRYFPKVYVYSPDITDVDGCLSSQFAQGHKSVKEIYVPANSTTLNTFLDQNSSPFGYNDTYWEYQSNNNRYYHNNREAYLYPIEDYDKLSETLQDFDYYVTNDQKMRLTNWLGTYQGKPSTKIIIDNERFQL